MRTVLVIVAIALLPTAGAVAEPLESGAAVELRLNSGLAKTLKREGVRLSLLKPAHAGEAGLTIPVTESLLDPHEGGGYLYLGGGFKWRVGKRVATVRHLLLDLEKQAFVAAVNGTKMNVAVLSLQQATRNGFDIADAVQSMKLTRRSALALNRSLGLRKVFKPGRSLGTATATGRFEWLTVAGGEITLAIDSGFADKLHSIDAELPMALDPRMATLLNETMGAAKGKPSLFSAGEPLGTVSFVAQTR
jgi:hypothetical protein